MQNLRAHPLAGMALGLIGVMIFGEEISASMIGFAIAVGAVVWFGRKARVSPAPRP
ncbi:MAG: hypothetical protein WBC95_07445 [Albidovulum sp.]